MYVCGVKYRLLNRKRVKSINSSDKFGPLALHAILFVGMYTYVSRLRYITLQHLQYRVICPPPTGKSTIARNLHVSYKKPRRRNFGNPNTSTEAGSNYVILLRRAQMYHYYVAISGTILVEGGSVEGMNNDAVSDECVNDFLLGGGGGRISRTYWTKNRSRKSVKHELSSRPPQQRSAGRVRVLWLRHC